MHQATTTGSTETNAPKPADGAALASERLQLALHPIFDMASGALYGVEARLQHHDAEEISIDALRERAARQGRLPEFEFQHIERALTLISTWDTSSTPKLFIKVDARLLLDANGFCARLEDLLWRAETPKWLMILMLNDQRGAPDPAKLSESLKTISARGFQIALDHFGGGTNLKALHSYDVNFLKVDGYFTNGVAEDQRKRFLLSKVIQLTHMLGMKAICAGVARNMDLALLQDMGVDFAQGHLLGGPQFDASAVPLRCKISVKKRQEAQALRRATQGVKDALVALEPARIDCPLHKVVSAFSTPEHPRVLPIVDNAREPLGVLVEQDLRPYLHSQTGLSLLRNPSSGITLAGLLRRYPLATIETDPDRMVELLSGSDCDGVVITSGQSYMGFLPAQSLIKISNAKRVALAQDANPLTRLPGNRVVSQFFDDALLDVAASRHFAYFDFDNFKPFNDMYGFRIGDRAIMLFSDILKKIFGERDNVICHIGGDDFFVGSTISHPNDFLNAVAAAQEQFAKEAESFYSQEHRLAGMITATGRDGVERRHPLLRCSAGVMLAPPYCTEFDAEMLASEISRVKKAAKESESGLALLSLSGNSENLIITA